MMFDFLRDLTREFRGIDSEEARRIDREKREEKKQKRVFIPIYIKRIIYIILGIYLAFSIISLITFGGSGAGMIIRTIIIMASDIAALSFLILKTKRSEIIGLICVGAFIVLLSTLFRF